MATKKRWEVDVFADDDGRGNVRLRLFDSTNFEHVGCEYITGMFAKPRYWLRSFEWRVEHATRRLLALAATLENGRDPDVLERAKAAIAKVVEDER